MTSRGATVGKAQGKALSSIEVEALGEQAAALGFAARKMLKAVDAWRNSNRDPWKTQDAADAVQSFLIQRELMGLRDRDYAIEFYDIPKAITARIGAKLDD